MKSLQNPIIEEFKWKILTIDNTSSSNKIIELISEHISFQNRNLSVLKASTLEEGKNIIKQNSDIALILVDIMMEDKNSGLEFIRYVRDELKNQDSRIILRTGYPDSLPEKNVIHNYEIDGYIPKEINSELQIEVAIITAIRNYHQIITTKESLRSLAGSIAHELRNPLNVINLSQIQAKELLLDESKNHKEQLLELSSYISNSVSSANNIINIILSDLKDKPVDPSDFSYLNVNKVLPEIIKSYGYSLELEKQKVKLDLKDNFIFKAIDDRFTFIIYNLLKNALYYLKEYPDSIVTVGVETSHPSLRATNGSEAIQNGDVDSAGLPRSARNDVGSIDYSKYNVIYVHDTGPGIPSHILPKLFGDFFTAGKKEGTGLGLAFCKRNMKIFGGDIIVQSEPAKDGKSGWTKFSLLFPKLTEEEIKAAETIAKRRKVLIVDDQETNLTTTKLKIEQNLKNIICDIALGGKEAINLAKINQYHLILMDIQMPEINGIKAAKEIREFNKDIPIIAFTSLCYQSFLKEAGAELNNNDFNYCLNKSAPNNILYRTITKWITDINDDFSYLGSREEYQTSLQNKNILLADDQKINLMMIKRNLEKNGAIVTEAVDGKELLEIYKNSLDEEGKSNFDMIITDIHMPPYDGDEAAKEIRVIELGNNLKYKNIIPIIAISGDGRKEDIYHFFNSGITDYFIKGSDPELLLKVVASYLIRKDNKIIESQIENKQSVSKLDEIIYEKIIHQILDLNKISFFGQEDQKTIVELFVKEGNKIIALIRQDNTKLHFLIHSLKGISGNIGATKLFEYTKEIDTYLKQNKPIENKNWVEELEGIYEETVREAERFLTTF